MPCPAPALPCSALLGEVPRGAPRARRRGAGAAAPRILRRRRGRVGRGRLGAQGLGAVLDAPCANIAVHRPKDFYLAQEIGALLKMWFPLTTEASVLY